VSYSTAIDFEMFRVDLDAAARYNDGAQGGWPPHGVAMMFKILGIQAQKTFSDDHAAFLAPDRLSFMWFLGLGLNDRVSDSKTTQLFGECLIQAGALKKLFTSFEAAL
jgi:transposase, IS5 family